MNDLNLSAMRLRFASYNILHGKCADKDMSGIAKNITENEIDIVGIQEIDRGTLRSGEARAETFSRLFPRLRDISTTFSLKR